MTAIADPITEAIGIMSGVIVGVEGDYEHQLYVTRWVFVVWLSWGGGARLSFATTR